MKSSLSSKRIAKRGGAAAFIWYSVIGTLLLTPFDIFALVVNYSTERNASLRECDDFLYRGQRLDAQHCYSLLLGEDTDVRLQAEAAWSLGDLKLANSHFQTSIKQYPEDPNVRVRWGYLFHATHQDNEASSLFQEALELEANHAGAKLGLAKVSAGRFGVRARAWVEEVLTQDDEALEAYLLLARMELEDGSIDDADELLDKALAIADLQNLPPLEAYALKASVDLLKGVTDSPWTSLGLEFNPIYGEIYATPAHFYVITRRYREAISLLQQAVDLQPDLWSAHAELGINLLRVNRIVEAQAHLATAYEGDPFSAKIVNTLRLIDSFENFQVIQVDAPRSDLSSGSGVIMRLNNEEAEVLQSYVHDLVQRSIEVFSQRYGFNLVEPVVVELYPEHDDFAVRISGLPGIGLLGVTFGYLVAMDSPSGRGDGDYHWGTTLWHEMAHVFTLEATNHLVPRWYSEGISVFEEWSTGPLPGRHIPLVVMDAIREGKLLPTAELDSGFIRPTYEDQVIVSYMQAGLICQYIEARWGQHGLVTLLRLFGEDQSTPDAIVNAFSLTLEAFDAGFKEFLDSELAPVIDDFTSWQAHTQEAYQAAEREDWPRALEAAEQAIALYPEYVGEGNPHILTVKAYEVLGETEEITAALQSYWQLGGHDPIALTKLGQLLHDSRLYKEAISVLSDVIYVAPLEEDLHVQLGDWLLQDARPEQALQEYKTLLAMDSYDRAASYFRLAQAYHALEDEPKTREHLLYALEIAPHYRDAQQLLLEVVH